MSENTENNTKTKAETVKIDGVSAQINLSPGSDTHRRFAQLMRDAGAATARAFIETLMDTYQNPPEDADSAATIAAMEKQLADLRGENRAYDATCQNQELEIADLKAKLEEANRTANDNAVNGLGKQAQIDDLRRQLEGAIVIKPNPVVAYFLDEMARETGKSPAEILQSLYIDDLQNPMANNLPYVVTSSRIREVMAELKNNQ